MQETKAHNRLAEIDIIKSLAIFLVIIYHSTIFVYEPANKLNYLFMSFVSVCVPLFFFANGYLIFKKEFVLREHIVKIFKLIILTGLWAVIKLFLLMRIRNEIFSLREILGKLWNLEIGWLNSLWFMGALISMYMVFPILKIVYDKSQSVFIYFIIVCGIFTMGNTMINETITFFVSIFVENPPIIYGFNIFNFLNPKMSWDFNFFNVFNPFNGAWDYAYVYFCMGGYMYLYRDKIRGGNIDRKNDIAVIGIIISCLIRFILGLSYSRLTGERWDIVWNGYGSIFTLITVLCIYVIAVNLKADHRIIRIISENTLGIYFIHEIIVALTINKLINVMEFKNIFANIIYAVFLLFTSLFIVLIIKKIPGLKRILI